MDETLKILEILIGINTAVVGSLALVIWGHIQKCADRNEALSGQLGSIATDVARIKEDIGDHEKGIRGWLHEQAGVLTRHELDIERLKK